MATTKEPVFVLDHNMLGYYKITGTLAWMEKLLADYPEHKESILSLTTPKTTLEIADYVEEVWWTRAYGADPRQDRISLREWMDNEYEKKKELQRHGLISSEED